MSLTIMADGVEAARGGSKRKNSLLRKQLAVALRSVQTEHHSILNINLLYTTKRQNKGQ